MSKMSAEKLGMRILAGGKQAEGIVLVLAAMAMAAVFLGLKGKVFPGSPVDWISQHSVLPDYFRKLFYETGEIYPDFAMQIGGGQNIFNFAYYGLLNPCIMISWLFPWIPMDYWIMGISLASFAASVGLFHQWIRSRGLEKTISIYTSIMFMLAAPLFYHFCVQIMFVNYMPFLCMGLIGTDRYFEKKKAGLLCISLLLMILTSFFFSIGGIMCLCIYALYSYLRLESFRFEAEPEGRFTIAGIVTAALKYMGVIFTAVLLSCFYLVPTGAALFGGRSSGSEENVKETLDFLSLLLPFGNPDRLMYDAYGIGLGCLSMIAVLAGMFCKETAGKVLCISLFLITACPVFSYAMNGFLYNRGKVLIPFLPLMCFQTGLWLSSLKKSRRGIIPACLFMLAYFAVSVYLGNISLHGDSSVVKYLLDLGAVMLSVLLYCRWKKDIRIIMVPAILMLVFASGTEWMDSDAGLKCQDLNLERREEVARLMESAGQEDHALYRMEYYDTKKQNFQNINRIFEINQNSTSLYSSSYNSCYSDFRNHIFDVEKTYRNILMEGLSENVIFRKIMGVRYLIADRKPVGYDEVQMGDRKLWNGLRIFKDESAAPVVYGTGKTISVQFYNQLKFPYNQLALLRYAVSETKNQEMIQLPELFPLDISYEIEGNPQGNVSVKLPKSEKSDQEQILCVMFHVKNLKNKDVVVKMGSCVNNLSSQTHLYYNENTIFTYAVGIEAGQEEIIFNFGKGSYEITDSEAYLVPMAEIASSGEENLYEYEFRADERNTGKKQKNGHILSGTIQMEKDGYLITSIPYDSNFNIYVDGKEKKAEVVNEGFLGTELSEGNHAIVISYKSPGKKVGVLLTVLGVVIAVGYLMGKAVKKDHV